MLRRRAWAVVAPSAVLAALDTAITAQYRPLLSATTLSEHAFPAVTFAGLFSAVMGGLILSRYPRHVIGWLLVGGGTATTFSLATEAYSSWVADHGGPGSPEAGHVAAWLSLASGASVTLTTLTAIFLLAPDGRLPSRRWRWALVAALVGLASFEAAVLTVPPSEVTVGTDPHLGTLTNVLANVSFVLLAAGLLASVVSVVRRQRRARGLERLQLRWITASATALAIGLAVALAVGIAHPDSNSSYGGIPLYLAYFAFPVCTAVAVLRYRLFDIDLILNRAVVLTLATGFAAAGYVVLVVWVGDNAGGFWRSLLATAVVAMAFQPLRSWVVRLADRLAYGAAATPYEALADFSRRLGESPDPSRLLPAVADAAGTAVHARRATARLPVPGAPDLVGTWPAGEADGGAEPDRQRVEVPVADRGETLGSITVEMPAGRDLRAHDARLLRDLADQAAIAFRNAGLSAELAHRVEQLDRQTLELVESRRRLITAGDAERRRLERAIAREVVPHLEPLPTRLEGLARSADAAVGPSTVQPFVAAATAALEALREITRGVFPAQLARSGLEAALGSLLGRTGSGRLVVAGERGRRLDDRVEAAAYFCVAEAVRELGPPVEVVLDDAGDELRLAIRGRDGGHLSLAHMRDRVEAVGGTVTGRAAGMSTVLDVCLPVHSPAAVTA